MAAAQSSTSQAIVFSGAGEPLQMHSLKLPTPGDGQVLVRITCCTICGSDVHTYQGHRTTPVPTILGHEILGRIESFGSPPPVYDYLGQPLNIGDRITWSIAASCAQCFYCNHDVPQKCEQLFKYGHESIDQAHALSGGLAEYCLIARGTAMIQVPDDLPDATACPSNCATATVAAALRTGSGCENETVLIQGAGMLGLTACAMARWGGAREVIACDIDADRLAWAGRFGATQTVLLGANDDRLASIVHEVTDGRGVDLALELSGSPDSIENGIDLLRIGGRYIFVGSTFPTRPVALSPEQIVRQLITIRGIHNYTADDLVQALRFLSDNHQRYPFAELVSKTYTLQEVDQAFKYAIEHRPHRVAVVPN